MTSPRARFSFLICTLLAGAVFVRLGVWQLSRLAERRSVNRAALESRELPVLSLEEGPATSTAELVNRRVRLRGTYDHTRQIVLRDFVSQGAPGVRVLSPLRPMTGDSAILVLRGFVPAPDAMTIELDSLDEPGEILVEGVALPFPAHDEGPGKLDRNGRTTWRRLDLAAVRAEFPYPVRAAYVIATRSDPAVPDTRRFGLPIRLEPPPLNDGPHLDYAIQWFAFAIIAVAVGVIGAQGKRTED